MYSVVPLDKRKHDRAAFDCRILALNNYLASQASQQGKRDNARTYILPDPARESGIMGYYTLALTAVDVSEMPPEHRKKHATIDSCSLIARLAVDHRYQGQGQGHGRTLLIDALKRNLQFSQLVGCPLVAVDAKDGASAFYLFPERVLPAT
ncbi:MAG: GNAT family N-acetyltransferase [Candidatus Thiodiazotropha weberae]|nr:GNAT family N-acetyltransferase [Candidatus Thiodiazotropha weberae]